MTENSERSLSLEGRLALRPKEAADALGMSERALRALLPQIPCIRQPGLVLIPVEGLRQWLAEQARAEESRAGKIAAEIEQDLGASE